MLGAIQTADAAATTRSPAAATAPAAPTVTAVGHSLRADVSWSLPANHGSPITKYVVKVFLGTRPLSAKTNTCTQPCTPARTATIRGLGNGKAYTFKVSAWNAKGAGPAGATTIKISASGIKPGAPANPQATAGAGSATVSWGAAVNGSATITGYVITPFRAGVAQAAVNVGRAKTKKITGLTVGQSYTFRVAAKNAVGTGTQAPPTAAVVPIAAPSSMEALGDSISVGFSACGSFTSCPGASWSTGTTVSSHYEHLLTINPAISGHAFNVAQPGAPVSSLAGQVNHAISDGVGYVTVLIGGNDVCRPDESQMTPVDTFRSTFRAAMQTLASGLPNAKILVASIPDLYRTWQIGKDNPSAVAAWNTYSFCASMFANPTSTNQADVGRRQRVRQRIVDDNAVLADECSQLVNCKYDGDALFAHQWTASEISTVDYIHPSAAGQQVIAQVTNAHGYNW